MFLRRSRCCSGSLNATNIKAFLLVGAPAGDRRRDPRPTCSSSPALDYSHPENSESGDSWLGLGPPLVIGIGFLLMGVLLMLLWAAQNPDFFRTKATTFEGPLDGGPGARAPAAQ